MSYDLLFQQALAAHEQGHFDEAEQIYRQILETAPENPDVLNLLGLVAQAKGIHNQAIELFYKAIKQAPKHAPFYFNLAISLAASGHDVEALDNLQKACDIEPDEKEIYNQQGLVLQKLKRITEAQQAFLKALQLDENYAEAKTNLALTYAESNPEKAIAFLQEIANQFSEDVTCRYYLCTLFFDKQDYENAQKYAMQAHNLNPSSDEVLFMLGLLALQKQNITDAKMYFQSATEQNSYNIGAWLNLANLETNEKDFDNAEKIYKKLLDIAPQNFDVHLNYANMLYQQHRLNEALEEYRAAVIINPEAAPVSNNIGVILKDLQQYEDALGLFFNALARDQTREEYAINISETLVLLYRQNKEIAVQVAENWLKNMPDNLFAQHICASLKGEKLENNQIFAEKLFDNFADNYELVLEKINYSLPRRIRDLAGNVKGTIVDLGCGSGLIGQALKTPENQIIGVDISRNMLHLAAQKGVYKQLIKGDITAFCQKKIAEINPDLIVAADVFGYIGNLAPVLSALRGRKICFSVEVFDENGDYKLNEAGRYLYNEAYITNLLQQNGFTQINKYDVVLRQEDGKDVNGLLFFAQ